MPKSTLPITERTVSNKLGRPIKSPILVSNLKELHMDTDLFLKTFSPFFEELSWDYYDVRRLQLDFLKNKFAEDQDAIQALYKSYFTGKIKLDSLEKWTSALSENDSKEFQKIQPWRRRSVARFILNNIRSRFFITRQYEEEEFVQGDDEDDFRTLPRVFQEAPEHHLENHFFASLLIKIFKIVQTYHPECTAKITAHFMSVKATSDMAGDNSPEGAHEDGANYIMSALVVNRKNIVGGESQVLEKMEDGSVQIILKHTLQPGEFIFQADTGEEKIFGNDLWHHVTPFEIENPSQGEGWRDIIGFDIQLVEGEATGSEFNVQF